MQAFRTATFAFLFALVLAAPTAVRAEGRAAGHARIPFELINATFDSITAFAVAAAGSGTFQDVDLGGPLQGGLNSITFDLPAGTCVRDLRVTFRNGRTARFPSINVCRSHQLRLSVP